MGSCCDLQVDVNGEGVFMVDKETICFYSGRVSRLLCNSTGQKQKLKVIFHDFPGGAEVFELVVRFCYSNGYIDISRCRSNIILLLCAAYFMEMNKSVSGKKNNLIEHTERLLEGLSYWSWSDLLGALKQSRDLSSSGPNSMLVIQKLLDALLSRLASSASESSPCLSTSSPDSFGLRFSSCDSRSSESFRTCSSRTTWWFEDLVVLNLDMIEMLTKCMLIRRFDHAVISRFLLYYHKVKFACSKYEERCKIMEMVINALYCLEQSSIPYKGLFGILTGALNLKISKCSRDKLEGMIGSRMDEATLDNLLVPAPCGSFNYLYDVNLVLRLLKSFLCGGGSCQVSPCRTRKVAILMDLYLSEVAPDPSLNPSKFISLAMMLPDSARDSFDKMYHAIDMYLEVHPGLSEEEKLDVCCVLNYEKLSPQTCFHLAQNQKLPSRSAAQALISQQNKLKSLLQDIHNPKLSDVSLGCSSGSSIKLRGSTDEINSKKAVLYAGKPEAMSENEKLKVHLQGMQWRVMELEKVCRKLQSQMTKITDSRSSSTQITCRSLPKLCS
ncbi:hypothetical protein Dimus_009631 [Dionaea muscipula]